MKTCLMLSVFLLLISTAHALDPDSTFQQARELAVKGKYIESEAKLLEIINLYPEYTDVQVYLARVLAWQKKYDESDYRLYEVDQSSRNIDWWTVYSQNALWQNNHEESLRRVDQAPESMLDDPDLALIKGRALYLNGQPNEAIDFLNSKKEILNEKGLELLAFLNYRISGNYLGLNVHYAFYEQNDGLFYQARGGFLLKRTQVEIRLNHGKRFDLTGNMAELIAYPVLSYNFYIMMAGGISDKTIYPVWYAAIEPHLILSGGWEVSAGGRYLEYIDNDITIATISVSKYLNDWLASLRANYVFRSLNNGLSVNATATYFFTNRYHKMQFNAGAGQYVPETQDLSLPTGISTWWAGAEYIFPVYKRHHLNFRGEIAREKPEGVNSWRLSIFSGYLYFF